MARSNEDINADWQEQMNRAVDAQKDKMNAAMAGLFTLIMFMATYELYKNVPLSELDKAAVRQRSRYTIHETMESKDGPWNFSPAGYMEGTLVNAIMQGLEQQGIKLTDITQATTEAGKFDQQFWQQMQFQLERQGQMGTHESIIQGQLDGYWGYDVIFQWRTCEDNDNCTTDSPVCPECESYSLSWFTANDFPETPHDLCRCNEPEVVMQATNRAFI